MAPTLQLVSADLSYLGAALANLPVAHVAALVPDVAGVDAAAFVVARAALVPVVDVAFVVARAALVPSVFLFWVIVTVLHRSVGH